LNLPTLPDTDRGQAAVIGVPWSAFEGYFRDNWEPGQHVALVGPTGEGKSTLAVRVLGLRKYVLALDPKGGDDTLAASGFRRIGHWPPPSRLWDEIAQGAPARLILGERGADFGQLADEFDRALEDVLKQGGWTVYIDEFQIMADRRMMAVGARAEQLLISARYKKVSVVTAFQAPSWVPTASTRQARWVIMWPTRDEDCIKAVAAKAGRDKRQVMAVVQQLPPFHALVIPPRSTVPMIITTAPRLD
jgi:energy-coupling factor transporter ATP-binding protein EcfA2